MSDKQKEARDAIESAIAGVVAMGMQRERAIGLLAFQMILRTQDQQELCTLVLEAVNKIDDRKWLNDLAIAAMNRAAYGVADGDTQH